MPNTESRNIERVISALRKVPAAKLLIIELANKYTVDGKIDYTALENIQPEVEMALAEAKMYGARTIQAVENLKFLEAISSDVGLRDNSTDE